MAEDKDIPNPTEEQYLFAKSIVEAYESKTGEKVVSVSVTWDNIQDDYLKSRTKTFPYLGNPPTEEEKEFKEKFDEHIKNFFGNRLSNNGKC